MATVQELSDSIDSLGTAITDELISITAEIIKLQQEDNGIDPALLDPLKEKIDALKSRVTAFDPANPQV